LDETEARLIAGPTITKNIHEIEAEGDFRRFAFRIEGHGLPYNPKSLALIAMSLVHTIARRRRRIGF